MADGNSLLIYKSSAGSGKTYTLVLEYLKLVLKKPTMYRSVLAITFTNKATEEMKTRIIKSLATLASGNDLHLLKALTVQTGLSENEIPVKAERVLELILHDYSGFSVTTIDSFFSGIVRSLARELNLPLRFDLELDMDFVSGEITSMMFDELTDNKDLKQWLKEFLFDKLDKEKGWSLINDIQAISKQLFDERYRDIFPNGSGTPQPEFIEALRKISLQFENDMATISKQFLKIIADNGLSVQDFNNKSRGIAGYLERIGGNIPVDKYLPNSYAQKAFNDPAGWTSKSSALNKQIIALAEGELINLTSKIEKLLEKDFRIYVSADAVMTNAYMAGIIGTLDKMLARFRADNDIILISDNNLFLRKSIDGTDAPFIYEKCGNKFTHFMLDEFQDTSDFQWKNLKPLIQNALGSGNYSLIVGDAKQSIYRWRGGNMNLLQSEIQQELIHFNEITETKNLDSNYRSRQIIVDFNNRFFELAPATLQLNGEIGSHDHPYETSGVKQSWKKGSTGEGYVKIKFLNDIKSSVDEETGEETEDAKWKAVAGMETVVTVKNLLNTGFNYKDIAILTRTNSDAKLITSQLMEQGIDYIISPESMQLNRSSKINFLLDLLTFINDHENHLALSNMVYYYRSFLLQDTTYSHHDLFGASRKTKLQLLPAEFIKNVHDFRKMPLFDAIEELILTFKLVSEPDAYIQRFTDVILEYIKKHPANITDFLLWWEENQDKEACSVIIPSNMDAIRVMSIHKSKGLQFPVVIIPYTDWKMVSDHKTTIWVSSDTTPFNSVVAHPVKVTKILEHSLFEDDYNREIKLSTIDNLNMLYVAFTRAEEQLYIFSKTPPKKISEESLQNVNSFFYTTLSGDPDWKIKLDENESYELELGTCNGRLSTDTKQAVPTTTLGKWISTPWKDRLKMIVNKRKVASADPDLPDATYGIHFHNLAAQITTPVAIEDHVENYSNEHKLDVTLKQKLLADIRVFVSFASKNNWFDPGARTVSEADILLTDGSVVRPDRLIIKDNNVIVIDYKTGTEEPYHESQIRNYGVVLNGMGLTVTKMYLVYPALEKLIEVNAA